MIGVYGTSPRHLCEHARPRCGCLNHTEVMTDMLNPRQFLRASRECHAATDEPRLRVPGGEHEETAWTAGLSENEINTLYNVMRLIDLDANEALVHAGEANTPVFLVLDGELIEDWGIPNCVHEPRVARKGDWVAIAGFTEDGSQTCRLLARTEAHVMALTHEAIATLDERTQRVIYRHLSMLSASRIAELERERSHALARSARLIDTLYERHEAAGDACKDSKLVVDIIEKIPNLPAFIGDLVPKLQSEDVDAREIANLIKHDPSLAANILKTLNSPLYGLQQKISDITSAITYLGFQSLYELVVSEAVKRTMPKTSSFQKLHLDAVGVSHIAFLLSRVQRVEVPVQMSTIGLLHNLGQSVIELLKSNNRSFKLFIDIIDQAHMGALLLEKWNLPEPIWRPVQLQTVPEFALPYKLPEAELKRVALLFVAKRCYQRVRYPGQDSEDPAFLSVYAQALWDGYDTADGILRYLIRPELKKKNTGMPGFLKKLVANYR